MNGFIYKYTFPDGKVYIGQTVRPIAARHREHTMPSSGKYNVGFWEAWQKYGDAKLEILETVDAKDASELTSTLNRLESAYVDEYNALNPQFGYNRVPGGYATSATKKALMKYFWKLVPKVWGERAIFFKILRNKIDLLFEEPVYLEPEEIAFVNESVLPIVDDDYRGFITISDNGELSINIDSSDDEADEDLDDFLIDETYSWLTFAVKEIEECERDEVYRVIWDYVLSNSSSILSEKAILKIDKEGNVVKEYESITEVMHDLNLSYSANIYNVLEGKQKTAYGFVWKWKNH